MAELAVRKEELMGIHQHLLTQLDKKADDAAAKKKKEDDDAAAAKKKKEDDDAAAKKKKEDDDAAAKKKKEDDAAAAKKKKEEEAKKVVEYNITKGTGADAVVTTVPAANVTAVVGTGTAAAPEKYSVDLGGTKEDVVAANVAKWEHVVVTPEVDEGCGAMPWIIAGVVVVLGGVGGFFIYKKSKEDKTKTKEGGTKALFKTQIKKNVAHKESLV